MPKSDKKKTQIDYSQIYSPYKLGMFAQCPKQYHFFYLDPVYSRMKNELKKLPENIWKFNTLGKAVHNAITLFYHLPEKEKTAKNLLGQLKSTWTSEVVWSKKPPLGKWGGFKTIEEERDSYREAILMLKNFFKMADINSELEYLPTNDLTRSIEDYLSLITPLSQEIDISGKFDLVVRNNNGLEIIDFKTGKEKADGDFQLRFYKCLAETRFEKPVKKASFYFLKTGNIREFDFTDKDTRVITKEIVHKIQAIQATRDFEARPSRLCEYCLFRTFCPKKETVRQIIKDIDEDDYPDDLPF